MTEERRGQIAVNYIAALLDGKGLPGLAEHPVSSTATIKTAEQLGIDANEYMEFLQSFFPHHISGSS